MKSKNIIIVLLIVCFVAIVGYNIMPKDGTKTLTLDDVVRISQKGEDITWDDLKPYKISRVTGSGLYIVIYDIDENYYLSVGNGGPELEGKPTYYIILNYQVNNDGFIDNDKSIDITKDDVQQFIKENLDNK